jgi:hypothetical protein
MLYDSEIKDLFVLRGQVGLKGQSFFRGVVKLWLASQPRRARSSARPSLACGSRTSLIRTTGPPAWGRGPPRRTFCAYVPCGNLMISITSGQGWSRWVVPAAMLYDSEIKDLFISRGQVGLKGQSFFRGVVKKGPTSPPGRARSKASSSPARGSRTSLARTTGPPAWGRGPPRGALLYLRPDPEPHDFRHFRAGVIKMGSVFTNY